MLSTLSANSPSQKRRNFIPEYSVKYPAASSDSLSGRSNGARFVSAIIEVKKRQKAMKLNGVRKIPHRGRKPRIVPVCWSTIEARSSV